MRLKGKNKFFAIKIIKITLIIKKNLYLIKIKNF